MTEDVAAIIAVHETAIDYYDSVLARGISKREAGLTVMNALVAEAALVACAMQLSYEDFLRIAATAYDSAGLLAVKVGAEKLKNGEI